MAALSSSSLTPFKYRVFSILWIATLLSNIGTWMFNVTSGWLMTMLSPSPFMVSLVQVATSLPIFLFALPAGALGDMFDRRTLLLITQIASALIMILFAGLLEAGQNNILILLFFTFLSGASAAFSNPAWQAIIPALIPKESLQPAIALNGVSINIARAIGPALGGFILMSLGAAATVMLNGLSFVIVIAALVWWRTKPVSNSDLLPREQLVGAMRAGVRFALCSQALRYTLIRTLAFFTFASAYWALLPLVAKELLDGGPSLYGLLLTALGAGALIGAVWLPRLKQQFSMSQSVALGTIGTALAMALFAYGQSAWLGMGAGVIAGVSWIIVLSALTVSTQLSLPDWVRARGMAIFQMIFFGAMTLGSLVWGQVASYIGLRQALIGAALCALLGIVLTWRFKLNLDELRDHTPSGHWPKPEIMTSMDYDRGPVLVTLEYLIDEADQERFSHLMREMGIIRRRDGAAQWGFFEDVNKPGHFIELFTVESWAAHLRQHSRVSAADKALQDKISALHQGQEKPRVIHAITPYYTKKIKPVPKEHYD